MPEAANNELLDATALETDRLPPCWQAVLTMHPASLQLARIKAAIAAELGAGVKIYPQHPWRALCLTPLADIRVVILGQDPYHGPGQAQGLAFSVASSSKAPPSLRNIFLEISRDQALAESCSTHHPDPDLTRWAKQGVLLLNTALTVRSGEPASHAKLGWQVVTDSIIAAVARREQPTVFMLWGAHAQSRIETISNQSHRHLILCANHPSPLSARRAPIPFLGCGHFGQANQWLMAQAIEPILW